MGPLGIFEQGPQQIVGWPLDMQLVFSSKVGFYRKAMEDL